MSPVYKSVYLNITVHISSRRLKLAKSLAWDWDICKSDSLVEFKKCNWYWHNVRHKNTQIDIAPWSKNIDVGPTVCVTGIFDNNTNWWLFNMGFSNFFSDTSMCSVSSLFLIKSANAVLLFSLWVSPASCLSLAFSHCRLGWWWWSGCTVPAPSNAAPVNFCNRWLFWSWRVCSETRFWSATRWGSARGRGSAAAALWCTGSSGTPLSAAAAAQP